MKKIVANWKMNSSFDQSDTWFIDFVAKYDKNREIFSETDAIICPPAVLIDNLAANMMDHNIEALEEKIATSGKEITDFSEEQLSEMMSEFRPFELGAQDCHWKESGAFTGDLSPELISQTGAQYVILGHSERRAQHHETNEIVAKKISAAIKHELAPILCVGESKETRDASKHLEFVENQLGESIPDGVENLIVAYEPIWSIGTGIVPSSEQIAEMSKFVKETVAKKVKGEVHVLYGGSANLKNAQEILSIDGVDGLLVGGASLNANDFFAICEIAAQAQKKDPPSSTITKD